jgi:Xaa-Pro aminopeptidase
MSERIARLQAQLEEPLLVSSLVNVRYLTGLASSNAALLVTPDEARIYTDFRYANRARDVPGVEFVQTRRDLYSELPSLVQGRVGFEPARSRTRATRRWRRAGSSWFRGRGWSRRCGR